MQDGKTVIFSAPSGSGKTTIVHHLLENFPQLSFSISATTRAPRNAREVDGRDYYFMSEGQFRKGIERGKFIEWEEVYQGVLYGTLKSEVERIWAGGRHVLFDVDVKGGIRLKRYFGDRALSVFVRVSDIATLEDRLRHRNTESEEQLRRRLEKAEVEMSFEKEFDVTLVSTELHNTLARAETIVKDYLSI